MKKRLPSNASFEDIAPLVLPILKANGVVRAGLFGSFARGEATDKSDIDLLVEFGPHRPKIGWLRYEFEEDLEKTLRRKVDLCEYQTIKPRSRVEIFQSEISLMTNKKVKIIEAVDDILECIGILSQYVEGHDFNSFENAQMAKDAVIRRIEIMGEAAKKIPYEVRANHPEIPWKSMAGMRDIAIHDYKGIKDGIVWEVATKIAPSLMPHLEKLIEHLKNLDTQ